MPNWCYNELFISWELCEEEDEDKATKEYVDLLGKMVESAVELDEELSHYLDFNKFVPIPKEKEEDWYNWQIDNWGTKWQASQFNAEFVDRHSSRFNFKTAWAPPREFMISLAKIYPNLYFCLEYREQGMGFAGELVFRDGVMVQDNQHDYYGTRGG